jgi:hypothetical protein
MSKLLKWAKRLVSGEAAPTPVGEKAAARDVLAERQRQIDTEGWTLARDDDYKDGSLIAAALAYALSAKGEPIAVVRAAWPESWNRGWLKPVSARRDLVKAAALLLAEIERLDRGAVLVAPAMAAPEEPQSWPAPTDVKP